MRIRDEVGFAKALKKNDHGRIDKYGGCVFFYAQHWANLMECAIVNGSKVADCADECSDRADKDLGRYGITSFQYGCAVSVLSEFWEHGEELRKWHNLKIQIKDEGERANKTGGVLNPAVLCIGS